jgi:hypothetical protein
MPLCQCFSFIHLILLFTLQRFKRCFSYLTQNCFHLNGWSEKLIHVRIGAYHTKLPNLWSKMCQKLPPPFNIQDPPSHKQAFQSIIIILNSLPKLLFDSIHFHSKVFSIIHPILGQHLNPQGLPIHWCRVQSTGARFNLLYQSLAFLQRLSLAILKNFSSSYSWTSTTSCNLSTQLNTSSKSFPYNNSSIPLGLVILMKTKIPSKEIFVFGHLLQITLLFCMISLP